MPSDYFLFCPRKWDSYKHLEYRVFNSKLMEIVDTMTRKRINIVCLQETKWVGEKSREIKHAWLTGRDNNRNGVGIIIDKTLKKEVV